MTDAPEARRIYLDANAFIEACEHDGPVGELLTSLLLGGTPALRPPLVTSELTLAELLVKPLELERPDLVRVYESWVLENPRVEPMPVSRDILAEAARLRASERSFKLPDAIHVATAEAGECSHFITDDTRLRSRPELTMVRLVEAEISELIGMSER
ncbi:MAG TPA: PIN domain-containing protein [Bauldia sp.]|nr:PIN domain-containing protein [Bauldia sp.]